MGDWFPVAFNMSLPIKATPILRGKDAVLFLKAIDRKHWGTKSLILTPKFEQLTKKLLKKEVPMT